MGRGRACGLRLLNVKQAVQGTKALGGFIADVPKCVSNCVPKGVQLGGKDGGRQVLRYQQVRLQQASLCMSIYGSMVGMRDDGYASWVYEIGDLMTMIRGGAAMRSLYA